MAFKVKKENEKPALRLVSFRLPNGLVDAVHKIAEREGIPITKLVKQMLEHCIADYDRARK